MSNLALVSVRVSQRERELLEAAADQSRTNLSDFIRRKAVEAAEIELLQQNRMIIRAKWKKFETRVDSPTKDVPALKRLSKSRPVWED